MSIAWGTTAWRHVSRKLPAWSPSVARYWGNRRNHARWVHRRQVYKVGQSEPSTNCCNTLEKLHRLFRSWYPEPLTAITVERIESWKAGRLNAGRSAATVLRDLFTLSSVLRRAVRAGELTENPVSRVDKPRIDRRGQVRFLDQAEESRLRNALAERDFEMQNHRTCGNNRRQTRHERVLPPLTHFGT